MTSRSRPALRRSKGAVDPRMGERIRQLRLAKGLTQVQLAGTDFSKGFISLLETGRTRMSLRAAEIFAHRLEVGVADLLEASGFGEDVALEVAVLRSERELAAGRPGVARELARRLRKRAPGPLRGRLLRLEGRALAQLAPSREAVRLLEGALREFRAHSQTELAVRTLYDLAVAHAALHQPGEALALALECQRALFAGEVVDRTLELQLRSLLGAIYVDMQDFRSADWQAERAADLAQDVVDRSALASLYAGLAITRQEQGDLEAALTYGRRSLQLHEELGRERAVAEAWHNLGWVYVQRKQYARAADALERAERLAGSIGHRSLVANALATRAELALARGEVERAVQLAAEAAAHPDASTRTRGFALLTKAQAEHRAGKSLAGLRRAFQAALKALGREPPHVRALVHEAFSDAMYERGDSDGAYAQARAALDLLRPSLR